MDYSITVHTALRVAALFARLPMLSGFSVQDRATLTSDRGMAPLDGDLCVADVSVDAWTGFEATLCCALRSRKQCANCSKSIPRLASCCAGTPSPGHFIDAREPS